MASRFAIFAQVDAADGPRSRICGTRAPTLADAERYIKSWEPQV